MADRGTFRDLVARVRAGDNEAAAELMRQYEPALRRAIHIRLVNPGLRRVLDSTDICQSVFGSFFVRAALGQYELETPQQLVQLLLDMSRKKLTDQFRHEGAARRDFRRMQALGEKERQLARADETPSQQVAGQELLREARKRLSEEERRLADQRAQGRNWAEIAADEGGTADAVRKKLVRAVERVTQELGLDR
jgi:RNA polymerase sigma-70 factor (ECF subfamily)